MFRLAVVGGGRMGRLHLKALREVNEIDVVGVVEPDNAARAMVEIQGTATFPDVTSVVNSAFVDGWLVAVSTPAHLEVVKKLAGLGRPILCEKPVGLAVDQTLQIAEVVAGTNVRFQVAYWRRYIPALQQLRCQLQAGEFGSLQSITCQQWDEAPPSPEFRRGSGGIFIDMGVHEVDQMRWLTGEELDPIAAGARSAPNSDDQDSAHGLVELSSGATGAISLGRHHPGGDLVAVEIFGTEAHLRIPLLDPEQGDQVQLLALRAQARDFIAGGGSGATLEDAVAALRVSEALQAHLA
jgi:myo-inositol 2-dehydrogenase/D-chiro-inositol 1-dehydrogenase